MTNADLDDNYRPSAPIDWGVDLDRCYAPLVSGMPRQGKNVHLVQAARRLRRTVRLTYSRSVDTLSIDIACGDEIEQHIIALSLRHRAYGDEDRERMEGVLERAAALVAERRGLTISRVDVD